MSKQKQSTLRPRSLPARLSHVLRILISGRMTYAEWRTGGDFRQTTARQEQPGQSRLPEPGSHRRQAAASLATLASGEAAGHL